MAADRQPRTGNLRGGGQKDREGCTLYGGLNLFFRVGVEGVFYIDVINVLVTIAILVVIKLCGCFMENGDCNFN